MSPILKTSGPLQSTLTPLLGLVKRIAGHPDLALLVSLATLVVTVAFAAAAWESASRDAARARVDAFGAALARELAGLAAEPVLNQDRIRLGVLTRRTVALPEVLGVGVYTVDGQPLAITGRIVAGGPAVSYAARVDLGDTTAGEVRVVLDRDAFTLPLSIYWIATWPYWAGAAAVAVLVGWALRRRPEPERPVVSVEWPDAEQETEHLYVLVVNLFNQISLAPERKSEVLREALARATKIANLYVGHAEPLSGTGLMIAFDDAGTQDRCFEVICAALLIARVLAELNDVHHAIERVRLQFRFGLHRSDYAEGRALRESDGVRDAVLLSAVAPDGRLATSAAVFDQLEDPQRVEHAVTANAATSALGTTGDACYIVHAVGETYQALLDRQAELLSA